MKRADSVISRVWVQGCLSFLLASSLFVFTNAQSSKEGSKPTDAAATVALVLVGDGEGVVTKIAPAVMIKAEGVMLVPYHIIKDAKELQVRLKGGEIFDNVFLLGSDERRDVAAIRIQTSDLAVSPIVSDEDLKEGEGLVVVSQNPGSLWTQTPGSFSASKMADEVPGAGQGFHIFQFKAELSAGMQGGVVFRSDGSLVGLITSDLAAPTNSGFAVPIKNVRGLADDHNSRSFGSGKALNIPSEASLKAAQNPSMDPRDLLLAAKTIYVYSNTTYFKEQQLINELNKRKEVKEWGWVFTTGSWDARNKADLIIELDHQILSFDFTFTVRHRKSSILISAGKAVIADGASGAPKMGDKIIKSISEIINPKPAKGT